MTNNDSYIAVTTAGTSFVGRDATSLYAAMTLASGLRLYAKSGIKLSRMHTPGNMLAAATRVTGKQYKRSQYLSAAADLDQWINTMRAALPVVRR